MKSGVIKSINRMKGYGFIQPNGSDTKQPNVFFHASDVVDPRYKDLRVNNKVDYIEKNTDKGLRAVDVVAYQS